jgi:hypothetical protein
MDAFAARAVLIWIKNAAPKFSLTAVLRALLGAIALVARTLELAH